MENQAVTVPKDPGITNHTKRKLHVKKAISANLAGIGSSRGLLFKTLDKVNQWLDGNDSELQVKAVDIVMKLIPYVAEKEGQVMGAHQGANGQTVLNVQINNFDTFIKDRLSHTNLGKLLSNIDLQPALKVECEEIRASGTTFTPPPNPGDGVGLRGTGGLPNEARISTPNTSDGTTS